MDFYYRVFTTEEKNIWAEEIEEFVNNSEKLSGWSVYGVVDDEDEDDLDAVPVQIVFTDEQDREVAFLEYDSLEESDELNEELNELQDIVDIMEPELNRAWVHEKLSKTVGRYAFNVSDLALDDDSLWEGLTEIASWIRNETNGIEQTDAGQLTNENGVLILSVSDDEDELVSELEIDEEFEEIDEEESYDEESDDFEGGNEDESFPVALWNGEGWIEKEVDSDDAFDAFLRGEL